MNLDVYISSGILERYVFGIANKKEIASVELMLIKFPEIKREIEDIEKAFEYYANQNQIQPPEEWRKNFLIKLNLRSKL